MAIGSNIVYVDSKTGKVKTIYNHISSHLMYSGRVLHDFYNTEEKVKKLFENGDIFCIGYSTDPVPQDKQEDEVYKNGNNHCVFFGRDKNEEKEHSTKEYKNLYEAIDDLNTQKLQQFTYLFKDGKWHYRLWRRRFEEMLPIRIFHDDEEDG